MLSPPLMKAKAHLLAGLGVYARMPLLLGDLLRE